MRKTAVAEACHAREVAHAYARGEIGLNVAHNAPGTGIRQIAARSGERSLLRIALTNSRLGKLSDTLGTLDRCFDSRAFIASVGRCHRYGCIVTLDHCHNDRPHWWPRSRREGARTP